MDSRNLGGGDLADVVISATTARSSSNYPKLIMRRELDIDIDRRLSVGIDYSYCYSNSYSSSRDHDLGCVSSAASFGNPFSNTRDPLTLTDDQTGQKDAAAADDDQLDRMLIPSYSSPLMSSASVPAQNHHHDHIYRNIPSCVDIDDHNMTVVNSFGMPKFDHQYSLLGDVVALKLGSTTTAHHHHHPEPVLLLSNNNNNNVKADPLMNATIQYQANDDHYSNTRTQLQILKKRKGQPKKVVCIPAPPAANSRQGGGELVPSDLWAWRKYGQKPIKGSPYPRGYYRCSSSRGCSARKQVERSRTDPNILVVTYTSDHNHPWPSQRMQRKPSTS